MIEDKTAAARRELLEETGYYAERMEYLAEGPPSAGMSTEIITFFRARGLRKVDTGGGVGREKITVHEMPIAEARPWLASAVGRGCLVDPKVYTGLYFAAAHD
jgi:ADP-ribose pyrophosphatase